MSAEKNNKKRKADYIFDSFYLWGSSILFVVAFTLFKYGSFFNITWNPVEGAYWFCIMWFVLGLSLDITLKVKRLTLRSIFVNQQSE